MSDTNLYSAASADDQQWKRIKSEEEILVDRIMACFAKRGEIKERFIYDDWSVERLTDYLEVLERAPIPEPQPAPAPRPNGHDTNKEPQRPSASDALQQRFPGIKIGQGYWQKTLHDLFMDDRMSATEKVMVNLLSALSGEKGYCWHSEPKIGAMMVSKAKPKGLSERQVRRCLGNIRDCGYIRILTPAESSAAGYDTKNAASNTIVMNIEYRS